MYRVRMPAIGFLIPTHISSRIAPFTRIIITSFHCFFPCCKRHLILRIRQITAGSLMQLAVIAITDIIACLRRFVCHNRFLLLRRKCYRIRLLGCRLILHGCSICLLYGCLICRLCFRIFCTGLCIFSSFSCLPGLGRCTVPCDPGSHHSQLPQSPAHLYGIPECPCCGIC